MADVLAPRAVLGALSVNNAQNVPSNRLSMGAKRSVGTHSRPSLAGRRSSLHSNAVAGVRSVGGRQSISSSSASQSLGPSTSSSSAASIVPSSGVRSSMSSRPSSSSSTSFPSSSIRSDPRPMHDKAYLKDQIHKIILYCLVHSYDRPLSPKLLLSPTSKDFRHLMEFFFRQLDPNFSFTAAPEEDIKRLMKALGYPFSLSKNALQAAGTPHTWPALLLMMAWMVDFLNYDEKVEKGGGGVGGEEGGGVGVGLGEVDPHPEKLFFDYLQDSYRAFIQGNDEATAQLEEELNHTFSVRHSSVSAEIHRLEAQRSSLLGEVSSFHASAQLCQSLRQKKAEYTSDVSKFEQLLRDVNAHKEAIDKKVQDRRKEGADRKAQEELLREEQRTIAATLAAQAFTPLQIQSMMHQQQMMQEALAELEQQKSRLQGERWDVERQVDAKVGSLNGLVGEFNAVGVSVELLPSTAKHANGADLQLSMAMDAASLLAEEGPSSLTSPVDLIQPDLKSLIKPVLSQLHCALNERVTALTSSSRVLHEEWVHLTEVRGERQRTLQTMEAALTKREDSLKCTRGEMNAQLQQLVDEVEQVECRIHEERTRRMRAEREAAEKALADAEAEKARTELEWALERQRAQGEMWNCIEELVNHAERIHTQLAHIAQQEHIIRQAMHKNHIP